MKKWSAFLLIFVLAFVFIGCTPSDDGTTGVTGVVISDNPTTLEINQDVQLSVAVSPATESQEVT